MGSLRFIRTRGFSMVEALLALFFLSVVLTGLITFIGQTGRTSLDAQYELLAFQIAREPIEVFRGFGADWVRRNYLGSGKPHESYPLAPTDLSALDPLCLKYPGEAQSFVREIMVEPSGTSQAVKVTVRVGPKSKTRAGKLWKGKSTVELRALLMPGPK